MQGRAKHQKRTVEGGREGGSYETSLSSDALWMFGAFLWFTWLYFHQTEWHRLGHFPLNSHPHLRETLYVRAQMGSFAPDNLSPMRRDIKVNLIQTLSIPSLRPPLSSSSLTSTTSTAMSLNWLFGEAGRLWVFSASRWPTITSTRYSTKGDDTLTLAAKSLTACWKSCCHWYFFLQCFLGSGLLMLSWFCHIDKSSFFSGSCQSVHRLDSSREIVADYAAGATLTVTCVWHYLLKLIKCLVLCISEEFLLQTLTGILRTNKTAMLPAVFKK